MEQERVVQKIYWSVDHYGQFNPQQYSQIKSMLRQLDSVAAFEALYTVLTNADRPTTRFADQELAGRLLVALQPPCPIEPIEAIQELLKYYNLSIEQIPWYFAQQYGKQAVLEILAKLKTGAVDERQQQCIETWKWWLQAWKGVESEGSH